MATENQQFIGPIPGSAEAAAATNAGYNQLVGRRDSALDAVLLGQIKPEATIAADKLNSAMNNDPPTVTQTIGTQNVGSGKSSTKQLKFNPEDQIDTYNDFGALMKVLNQKAATGEFMTVTQSGQSFTQEIFHKVTLLGDNMSPNDPTDDNNDTVQFEVSPEISESRNILLNEISNIYQPGSIHIWEGTPNRSFRLEATLVSRTQAEADINFKYLNIMKSWTLPPHGLAGGVKTGDILNGPKIVRLIGYGQHFKLIPVVVQGIDHSYPTDVDYIKSKYGAMPIIMKVSLSLKEVRTLKELFNFKIQDFKTGNLVAY